jgi:hypothetical protein
MQKSKRKQGELSTFRRVVFIGATLILTLFSCAYISRIYGAFARFKDADAVEQFLTSNLELGQSSSTDVQNFMDSYIARYWNSGRLWGVDTCSEPRLPASWGRNSHYDLALTCLVNAEPMWLWLPFSSHYLINFYFESDLLAKIEVELAYSGL